MASVKIDLISKLNHSIEPPADTKNLPISIVTPGDDVTTEHDFMRGHGTYVIEKDVTSEANITYDPRTNTTRRQQDIEKNLNASLAGVVEHIGKLVSVRPLKTRYQAKIGDVVVGRIVQVQQNRWKVDINGHLNANLNLNAVDLPGGELRRRDELDELSMRKHLGENDLISAEVQKVLSNDGGGMAILHTRSLRYGKLEQGILIKCSPSLIKPRKNHFHSFPFGVSIIIGNNGYIWINPTDTEVENTPVEIRDNVSRIRNCILSLSKYNMMLYDSSILHCFDYSKSRYSVKEMLELSVMKECASYVKNLMMEE